MTNWPAGPLLGFDTETTGVDTATCRIVTAALVLRVPHHAAGATTTIDNWLINPGVEIPAVATAVHGITTEFASANGENPVVALEQIATQITEHLRTGIPVVAFNAAFDLSLLEAELTRHGLETLHQRLGHEVMPVIDPLVLDRLLDKYRPGKRRLGDLLAVYGVEVDADNLHAADIDVLATLDVLAAMARRYPAIANMPLNDLHAAQITAHREWAENFNQWRARQGCDGPGASANWPIY